VFVIGNVVKRGLSGNCQKISFSNILFSGQIHNIVFDDLPAANEIIQICEGILIARADKNLVKYVI